MAEANSTHTIDRDSFDDAMTLISEVEAVIDLLGEAITDQSGYAKHTLQSSCLLAGRLLTEASKKLSTGLAHG